MENSNNETAAQDQSLPSSDPASGAAVAAAGQLGRAALVDEWTYLEAASDITTSATTEEKNDATAEEKNDATIEEKNDATTEEKNDATTEEKNDATTEEKNDATAEEKNYATIEEKNDATTEEKNVVTTKEENDTTTKTHVVHEATSIPLEKDLETRNETWRPEKILSRQNGGGQQQGTDEALYDYNYEYNDDISAVFNADQNNADLGEEGEWGTSSGNYYRPASSQQQPVDPAQLLGKRQKKL